MTEGETPRSVPAWAEHPGRPTPTLGVTILCWILVYLQAVFMIWQFFALRPMDALQDPVASLLHVCEVDGALVNTLVTLPDWEQRAYRVMGVTREQVLVETEQAYQRLAQYMGEWPGRSEDWPERFTPGEFAQVEAALNDVQAERARDAGAVTPLDARAASLLKRFRWAEALYAVPVVLGLVLVLLTARRVFRRTVHVGKGLAVPPWSLRYGCDVVVRCAALMFALQFAVAFFPSLYGLASLLTGFPVLLVMHYYLFRPDETTPFHGFGMVAIDLSTMRLGAITLGLVAIDQLGCLAILHGTNWAGVTFPWEEALDETLLFGSWAQVGLDVIDGVVWAPLFEEILFRGLLYVTLRTRFRPVPAALISGAIFGAVHLYSLAGFLEVFWSGVILALAYERCRSLWPCILAHAFNNLFVFGGMLVLYR